MSGGDDRELREGLRAHFGQRADESAAPPFERVWGAARTHAARHSQEGESPDGLGRSFGLPVTAAVAGAAVLILLAFGLDSWLAAPRAPEPDLRSELASAAELTQDWEAPLDFLLTTSGLELIETAPSFGAVDEEADIDTPAEGAQRSRPRERMTT
ncbi:MAG: hypothetical protein JRG82_15650 [Deltaproteobacteria bacterium]|nr:hypothetical protein [Deltaproteobacteria bacterium]